jgi:hypothetical protein
MESYCEIHKRYTTQEAGGGCPFCKQDEVEVAYHDLRKAVGNLLALSQAVDEHNLERTAPSAAWNAVSAAYNKCK